MSQRKQVRSVEQHCICISHQVLSFPKALRCSRFLVSFVVHGTDQMSEKTELCLKKEVVDLNQGRQGGMLLSRQWGEHATSLSLSTRMYTNTHTHTQTEKQYVLVSVSVPKRYDEKEGKKEKCCVREATGAVFSLPEKFFALFPEASNAQAEKPLMSRGEGEGGGSKLTSTSHIPPCGS